LRLVHRSQLVPDESKFNSCFLRLQVLADILDVYLRRSVAQSLGLMSHKLFSYNTWSCECCLQWYKVHEIPTKVSAMSFNKDNHVTEAFVVSRTARGLYYGVDVDSNNRCLTHDFTVTSNINNILTNKSSLPELFEKKNRRRLLQQAPFLTKDCPSSNSCTLKIRDVIPKRFMSMQEPDDNDSFKTGAMKELMGGDKIYSHKLFSNPKPCEPRFHLLMPVGKHHLAPFRCGPLYHCFRGR